MGSGEAELWFRPDKTGGPMRFTKLGMISLAAMTLSAATADGAVLTDYFSGIVTMSTYAPTVVVGQAISGSLTYDTSTDTLTSIGDSVRGQLSSASIGYGSTASVTAGSANFYGSVESLFPIFALSQYDVNLGDSFPAMSVASFLELPPPLTSGTAMFTFGVPISNPYFSYTANLKSFGGVAISSIPEPPTWAMALVGFVGLGFAAYRRRKIGLATAG
jgi:hypothetical protein